MREGSPEGVAAAGQTSVPLLDSFQSRLYFTDQLINEGINCNLPTV